MPSVLTDADLSSALHAATAVAAHLPGALVARPVAGGQAAQVLPGPDAVAVAVRLTGPVTGNLVLLVAAREAGPLLNGPLGAAEADVALQPALLDAVEALRPGFGAALQAEACRGVDATVAVDLAASAATSAVVQLVDGEDHVATLVLAVEAAIPAPRRAAVAPPADALDPLRLQLLHEVPMGVTVQLGSTRMTVRELLALAPGSVVELDRAAGSPVDVLVNGTLLARGEVVVVDEEYAVRISEIVSTPAERPGR